MLLVIATLNGIYTQTKTKERRANRKIIDKEKVKIGLWERIPKVHFYDNQRSDIEVLLMHQNGPTLLIARVTAACDNEAIKFIHVQENQKNGKQ